MKKSAYFLLPVTYYLLPLLFVSCARDVTPTAKIDAEPDIFPDYADVTIPCNIAPMDFQLNNAAGLETQLIITAKNGSLQVEGDDGDFDIPMDEWHKLLDANRGTDLQFTVCKEVNDEWRAFKPFTMHVSNDSIDYGIAYRLIPPGYGIWNSMGIYQRCLENFDEEAILTNTETQYNCMNCHCFQNGNPNKMVVHLRGRHGASLLVEGKTVTPITPVMPEGMKGVGYAGWHPTHNLIAMASYKTAQSFYANHKNRIEVYDTKTDVVVYNADKNEVYTMPYMSDPGVWETFPAFSADGRTLYWSAADTVPSPYPVHYDKAHFSMMKTTFNPDTHAFGEHCDTLLNAGDSTSYVYPRESPNGRWLVYNKYDYGYFPINHKEGDLMIRDMKTGISRNLGAANSNDAESYHTWSRNSHWLVFSSRRLDGLYIGAFFTHIDDKGRSTKAFLLPQRHPRKFYDDQLNSYNIPEFITGKVKTDQHTIQKTVW